MRENLSTSERAVYILVGLGLAAAVGAGAFLAWRGWLGSCPVKAALMQDGGGQGRLAA